MPGTVFIGGNQTCDFSKDFYIKNAIKIGAHIEDPKPLPKDLQAFLDGAGEGAIYFSFGTYVRSSEMPPDRIKMILDAFERIGRRVLWKYDDESIQNVPKNVLIRKWMPQNDILAHRNVILFISHGKFLVSIHEDGDGNQMEQRRIIPLGISVISSGCHFCDFVKTGGLGNNNIISLSK